MRRRQLFLIFLSALIFSLLVNEINRSYIDREYPERERLNSKSLLHSFTIWSIDNDWYLPQAYNLLNGSGLTLDPQNVYMAVRRTPGYSLFFFAHLKLFGKVNAYRFVRYTQVLFFSLNAVLFTLAVFNMSGNRRVSFIAGLMFSFSLFHIGWLYYTITEAIHPEMLITAFYFFSCFVKNKRWTWLFVSGAMLALAVLIRPFDGLILPFFALYLLLAGGTNNYIQKLGQVSFFALGFGVVIIPWIARNYLVSDGEFIPLEKYYQEDPMRMGKGHVYFRKWWSCWGISDTERLFPQMVQASKNDSAANVWVKSFVQSLPPEAFQGYEHASVEEALTSLLSCYRYKTESGIGFQAPHPSIEVSRCDESAKASFNDLILKYKQNNPWSYWISTPMLFAKEIIFQSSSSAIAMLNPEKREFNGLQVGVKGWMYLLNLSMYLSLIVFPWLKSSGPAFKILLVGSTIASLLYLAVFFRHIESRYMLQVYFAMYITLAYAIVALVNVVKRAKISSF